MASIAEEWRSVIGYEGRYAVSSHGRVRSLARFRSGRAGSAVPVAERILRPSLSTNGYPYVILAKDGAKRNVNIHRLVAKAFVPNPAASPEVNHADGDKTNNAARNLEWVSREENMTHASRSGLLATGDRHGRHTMPEAF